MEFDFDRVLEWVREQKKLLIGVVSLLGVIAVISLFVVNGNTKENDYLNDKPKIKKVTSEESNEENLIVVDVKGEVNRPNIYRVKKGTIIFDVLQEAGGTTASADTSQLNLASKVTDGQMITVNNINAKNQINNTTVTNGETDAKVNLNTATAEQLKTVPGIGDAKASMIIKYRDEKGSFKDIKELDKISGFGPKTIDKLKDYLTV